MWTDERVETLTTLWADGRTGGEIAIALGCGFSRCAVLGKLHRLGLSGRGETSQSLQTRVQHMNAKRAEKAPPKAKKKPAEGRRGIVAELFRAAEFPSEPVPTGPDLVPLVARMAELEAHHCRWIPGDISEGFCGRNKVGTLPYCEYHARRAYRAPDAQPKSDYVPGLRGAVGRVTSSDVHALKAAEELTAA